MPVNAYQRVGGLWVSAGPFTEPPPPPPPPPDEEEPPPQPGSITHGTQIPSTSLAALDVIGPRGTLTAWTGSSTLSGTQVIENRSFTNALLTIASGANITLRNCRIVSPASSSTYTIRNTAGGGARLFLDSCEIVTRAATTTPRCVYQSGDVSTRARRTIMRGGIDSIISTASGSPGAFATGNSLVPNARLFLEECWFGDIQRVGTSHSDPVQIDAGGFMVMRRCNLLSFNVPVGSDPLTARTNPATADLGGGGLIATQNSSNPVRVSHLVFENNRFEGGNYTVDVAPSDGFAVTDVSSTGNRFGLRHRFGPQRLPGGSVNRDNRWAATGITGEPTDDRSPRISVTAGQLLAGSSA
jgi:hypothetical protein